MALVEYASSDEDSPVATTAAGKGKGKTPIPAAASKLPQPNLSDDEDDDEEGTDPNDLFNVNNIQSSSTTAAKKAAESSVVRSAAPDVVVGTDDPNGSTSLITRPSDTVVFFNPTYQDMTRPVEGPRNPWNDKKMDKMNTLTGYVEPQTISDLSFTTQQRSFNVLGYASNPNASSSLPIVGDVHKAYQNGNELLGDVRISRKEVKAMKRKRLGKGVVGVVDNSDDEEEEEGEEGDAGGEGEEGGDGERPTKKKKEKVQKAYIGPWAGWEQDHIGTVEPTQEEWEAQEEGGGAPLNRQERKKKAVIDEGKREVGFGEEKSVFHGKQLHDYLGRSYLHPPTDIDTDLRPKPFEEVQECYVPKKCIHTWSGHTKGVSKIQLFPKSGHLLLSASLDTRIKLWDIYQEGKCLRTFMGHSRAVHDITFNNDGTKFLSAAFDRQMKLWDTETGQCLQAFSNGKIPYCVKFHPDKQNVFLAGMSDKKIIQYDMNSGEITQEYDQHLGPVNTINFVDENRRFVTTSDDKTIRVWDYDIPVVIKYIAEPTMHSMPAVGVHPSNKWLAMQSLDNQILIFGSDSFKQNRKKRFAGHTIAGYACEPQFSPDGRFLSSGDGQGNMVFWDWKTCRIVNRFKAHNQVIISHAWLPHETFGFPQSKLITSSWDGNIKLWD